MYIPKWYNKGVITISDNLDSEGTFLTLKDLRFPISHQSSKLYQSENYCGKIHDKSKQGRTI